MNNLDQAKIKDLREKLTQQNKDAARMLLLAMQNQVSRIKTGKSG